MIAWDNEGYARVYKIASINEAREILISMNHPDEVCAQIYRNNKLVAIKKFNDTSVQLRIGLLR